MSGTDCPSRKDLLAYNRGELPEELADPLIAHISSCVDCQAVLETFDDADDTLIARLRQPAAESPYAAEPQRQELVARAKALVPVGGEPADQSSTETFVVRELGEYQLLEKLGEGGMGAVYKARHTKLKKIVALKMLPKDRMQDARGVARLEREMEAVGAVDHPNIVRAMDAREVEGTHFLVMEYVEGLDLSELVRHCGPLAVADACDIVRQSALGLQYAHEHGLVHRDIKPSNLMVTREGQVKILDLGLALLHVERPAGQEMTASGQALGTPDYMAPEQATDSHNIDIRADIYGLGCTLYKLLAGHAPFSGPKYGSNLEKLMAHLKEPVPPIRDPRPDVPDELAAILNRMLAKDPADRFTTPAEVAAVLEPLTIGCDPARLLSPVETDVAAEAKRDKSLASTQPYPSSALAGTQPTYAPPGTIPLWERVRVRAPRISRPWAIGLALVLVSVSFGIVIWINRSRIEVPEGSEVGIAADGTVTVKLPAAQLTHTPDEFSTKDGRKNEPGKVTLKAESGGGRAESAEKATPSPRPVAAEVKAPSPSSPRIAAAARTPTRPPPYGGKRGPSASSPRIGPDGNWKLPPDAPPPAIAPFDETKAKEHQAAWAKFLGRPIEQTNSIGMKFVLIPPGEFLMGSTEEQRQRFLEEAKAGKDLWAFTIISHEAPEHRVKITRPFYLGKYEVTQAQWEAVMGKNPSAFKSPTNPVEDVSCEDIQRFLATLNAGSTRRVPSAKTGRAATEMKYALPTEAQWEYACRAGTTTAFSFGDDAEMLGQYAWFGANSGGKTHPVGGLKANAWGLYDMHGNVWEWCADWEDPGYYAQSPPADPPGPVAGSHRAHRGGGWSQPPRLCRSAFRRAHFPDYHYCYIGFRLACEMPEAKPESGKPKAEARTEEKGQQ